MSQHSHEYVGRHRKPDTEQRSGPNTDVLRRTLELFTHPQNSLNRHTKEKP